MSAWGRSLLAPLATAGNATLGVLAETGQMALFFCRALRACGRRPLRAALILQQRECGGFGSLVLVMRTGVFTGAVFTLPSVPARARVGMESMVGSTVLIAVARELAPVLAALMVTGRVGSAMATELGTMRVSEQIDAMEVMAVEPVHYLIVPRLLACAVMLPCLVVVFDMVASLGSYVVAVLWLHIDEGSYLARIRWYLDPVDFAHGIYKGFVFGVVIAVVGCFKGFHAHGGARGVGIATTQTVVVGSVAIFVLDYVLTSLMLQSLVK